jgi:hypothetical protein
MNSICWKLTLLGPTSKSKLEKTVSQILSTLQQFPLKFSPQIETGH